MCYPHDCVCVHIQVGNMGAGHEFAYAYFCGKSGKDISSLHLKVVGR